MAESEEKPVGTLGSHLTGHSDYSTTKPIVRKKKNAQKQRHGESTESRYSRAKNYANYLGLLKGFPHNCIKRK